MSEARAQRRIRLAAGALAIAALTAVAALAPARISGDGPSILTIATGSRSGVYYHAGGVICRLVNEARWRHGVRCVVEETEGSVANLRALRAGDAAFALVQSDVQAEAVRGVGDFAAIGPDRTLRAALSLHAETFTLLARPESGVASVADLAGKRVNLGPPGSGGRRTMAAVMGAQGMTWEDFAAIGDAGVSDLPRTLCDGEADAAVLVIAHPNLVVEEAMRLCDAQLVSASPALIERLTANQPAYFAADIPTGTYPGQIAAARSFAVGAILMASSRTRPPVVRHFVDAILGSLDEIRTSHPAFAALDAEQMTARGLVAPIHIGASRAFSDR